MTRSVVDPIFRKRQLLPGERHRVRPDWHTSTTSWRGL
jgi:hypothetical protein